MEKLKLRKFDENDIENKVKWINNPLNNKYLHYDIPLNIENTKKWFEIIKNNPNRYDMIIEYDNKPIGIIGIINIDKKKGEYYITIGDNDYKRMGIAYEATKLILDFAFTELDLEKVWLFVDEENIPARNLYEKIGFTKEGLLRKDIFANGKMINRYIYGILKEEWM